LDKKKSRKSKKLLSESPKNLGDKRALLRQYSTRLDEYKKTLEESSTKLEGRIEQLQQIPEKSEERSPNVVANKNMMSEVSNSQIAAASSSQTVENPQVEIVDIKSYPVDLNLWGFHLDSPQKGNKINSYVIEIVGWVLGRKSPALTLEILAEDRLISRVSIRKPRPGVAKHYKELPKAKTCGFAAEVGIAGLPQDRESELIVRAVLKDKTVVNIAAIKLRYQPQKTVGVLYIAMGKKYIEEAQISAQSLKAQMPNLPITILAHEEVKTPEFDKALVVKKPYYSFEDKVVYMYDSPYEYTLFLDTDTYICEDFSELFGILDNFDIAAVHAPTKIPGTVNGVPECYQQMNTGMILFKKSPEVQKFCEYWVKIYESGEPDQPSFREALFKSNLRIATLTAEYNCRFPFPTFVCGTVKILHGRHSDLAWVGQKINEEKGARVYQGNDFKL
jgi:hypothetical protein